MWKFARFLAENAIAGEVTLRRDLLTESTCRLARKRQAPQVGLEPTTSRLTAGCSTIELLRSSSRQVEIPRVSAG